MILQLRVQSVRVAPKIGGLPGDYVHMDVLKIFLGIFAKFHKKI